MRQRPQAAVITNGPVNPQLIPGYELDSLARSAVQVVRKFFEDPRVRADFEEWKRQQTTMEVMAQ